jgi:hypothetical protein
MTTTNKTTSKRSNIQTIKLEAYDDVISVRDRLQFVTLRRVLLIFPQHSRILTRKLDILMIQREAARRRIQLALLSQDPDHADHAHSLNLSCFTSVQQARSRRWKRGQTKLFVERADRPADSVQHPYELIGIASRLKPALSSRQRRLAWLRRLGIAAIVLVILLGAMLTAIPSATVVLSPAADAIREPITITADSSASNLDSRQNIVPAQSLRLVVAGDRITIPSSGRRVGEDSLAQGRVTFTNISPDPLFIPAGTVVSTDSIPPARFQTTSDTPLAVNGTGDAPIIALADTEGLAGNVAAQSIGRVEGPLETQVSVTNAAPTFGGGLVELPMVTQEDHSRLVTLARASVIQSGRTELLLQLPTADKFLVADSVQIVEERPEWFTYSAQVGDIAESVSLEMRGAVEAVVVDELQARQLAFLVLSQRLPPGRELNQSSLVFRRESGGLDEQGRYRFLMFVEGEIPFAIDSEAVANRINGMSIGRAQRTLENEWVLDPRYPPEIRIFPFNLGLMPLLPVRIEVEIRR